MQFHYYGRLGMTTHLDRSGSHRDIAGLILIKSGVSSRKGAGYQDWKIKLLDSVSYTVEKAAALSGYIPSPERPDYDRERGGIIDSLAQHTRVHAWLKREEYDRT
jgi:hypothetical protein